MQSVKTACNKFKREEVPMSKERTAFDPSGIIVFNRDVTTEDFKMIPESFEGDIIVHGDCNLYSEELNETYDLNQNASLWCMGAIYAKHIKINGSIFSEKEIHCDDLIVSEDVACNDEVDCRQLKVIGSFFCKGFLYASKSISVLGHFECMHDTNC